MTWRENQTDKTDYSKFLTKRRDGERIKLDHCEVHAVEHDADESRGPHTHEEAHIIFIQSGEMRWGVDGDVQETSPGDAVVTPGGVPHSYEVISDDPAKVICFVAPPEDDSDPGHT